MPETNEAKGNLSDVIIRKDTVIRDLKPQSATIHRLLQHLEKKGLSFVPRFLGLADKTHESLSFVSGKTAEDYPLSGDITSQEKTVRAAATMLRALHDATLDFATSSEDVWFLSYEGPLKKEVICHNDFAPYNVTFENQLPVGLIDLDTACPAPRIWDIAYALYRFVPLGAEVYDLGKKAYREYCAETDANLRHHLIHAFLESYGDPAIDSTSALEQVILRLQALVDLFDARCDAGDDAFIRMRQEGHQQLYRDEILFIKAHQQDWV